MNGAMIKRNWWDAAAEGFAALRWMHVHGAPRSGKTTFVEWLEGKLRDEGHSVFRLLGSQLVKASLDEPAADLASLLEALDLGSLNLPPETSTEATDLWAGLVAALENAGRHVVLILDAIDPLLVDRTWLERLVLSYRGDAIDPDGRLTLVTTACFRVHEIAAFYRDSQQFQCQGFREVEAEWIAEDEISVLVGRFEKRGLDGILPIFQKCTDEADGQPGLVFALLKASLDNGKAPADSRAALRKAKSTVKSDQNECRAVNAWQKGDVRSMLQARVLVAALDYMYGRAPDPDGRYGAAFALAFGLVHPERPPEEKSDFGESIGQRPIDVEDIQPAFNEWLMVDYAAALDQRLKELKEDQIPNLEWKERRNAGEEDPTMRAVIDLVQREFCDSERGRARKTVIDTDDVFTIIPGKQYSLRLKYQHEDFVEVLSGGATSAPTRYSFSSLHVFYGLPEEYRDAWQRHFTVLREVSNARHSSLPDIRQNATVLDQGGENETYGYLLLDNEGSRIESRHRSHFQDPVNRRQSYLQIRSLVAGLVKLQSRGLVHRMITRRNLHVVENSSSDYELRLGGFDLMTGALFSSNIVGGERVSRMPLNPRLLNDLVGNVANRRFFEPLGQSMFFEREQDITRDAVMPQSDVFGLCMTICDLFYGPPPQEMMSPFEAASSGPEAKTTLEVLLGVYASWIREKDDSVISDTLREIILSGLNADATERPTAFELQRMLLDNSQTLAREYQERERATYTISFDSRLMLPELGRNLRNLLNFDVAAPDAEQQLESFLERELKFAEAIFIDPDGYTRFVPHRYQKPAHDRAKIVIVARSVSFYCDYARSDRHGDYGHRVLMLRYTIDQRQHSMVGLVHEQFRITFPNANFLLLSKQSGAIENNRLSEQIEVRDLPPIGSWTDLLGGLRHPNIDLEYQAAFDAMRFVTEIVWQQQRLIQFQVKVKRQSDNDHGVSLVLMLDAFNEKTQADPYLNLLFTDAMEDPPRFLQSVLLTWLEEHSGPDEYISFRRGDNVQVRLHLLPEDIHEGEIRLRAPMKNLEGEGQLVFTNDMAAWSLYQAQLRALGDLRHQSRILEQLQRPHPTMALSRQKPERFGADLRGSAPDIVWDMVNAMPAFYLQGPPGTGKTRALSEYIYHTLSAEDAGAKFLVTAQNHASVDTTLERVADLIQYKDGEAANDRFHIMRHATAASTARVSPKVLERYDSERQAIRIGNRIQHRADQIRAQSTSHPYSPGNSLTSKNVDFTDKALEMLREAKREAPEEIDRRFRRNASLHFVTTASAWRAEETALNFEEQFHAAVIEEAGTGWINSLISPMLKARSFVAIGDHKQIGPFDSTRLTRLARRACGASWEGQDDLSAAGDRIAGLAHYSNNPDELTLWMEPFKRVFVKLARGELQSKVAGAKVIDTLDTQFRSVKPIGDLVSQTFYDGKVRWGGVEFDSSKAIFDLSGLAPDDNYSPSLVWLDTDGMGAAYHHERDFAGKVINRGEVQVLKKILAHYRSSTGPIVIENKSSPDYAPIGNRLMILSPYRGQLEVICNALRNDPVRYGFSANREEALTQILDVTGSADSAQGDEADTVVLLLTRSLDSEYRENPSHYETNPSEFKRALLRNYGFLLQRERANVMLSRARQQLIIIGNSDFYGEIGGLVDDYRRVLGIGSQQEQAVKDEYRFWQNVVEYFDKGYRVPLNTERMAAHD